MEKIKISAVSYTNTMPFVYGIKQSPEFLSTIDFSLDIPSDCARKVLDGRADIGLIPVAVIPDMPFYQIISDYCLGAVGDVNSVYIFSDKPIADVKTIRLDSHSRTSNMLARTLVKHYWKTDAQFGNFAHADAFVLIGDRTFGLREKYAYAYDLSGEWQKFTGLPFVFAAWVANKPIAEDFSAEFSAVLKHGVDHREKLLEEMPTIPGFDVRDYLMNHISYDFDEEKQKGMELFLNYVKDFSASEGLSPMGFVYND